MPVILEQCHFLDIDEMRRAGLLVPGTPRDFNFGPLRFRYDGHTILTVWWSREHRQEITITAYRHPWGHWRYAFEVDGRRVRRLYLVPAENPPWFRTRFSYPIEYHSRHLGRRRRRERTAVLLRQSLGATGFYRRPRGMPRDVWMSRMIKIAEIENAGSLTAGLPTGGVLAGGDEDIKNTTRV
jgi:hypothetical protein